MKTLWRMWNACLAFEKAIMELEELLKKPEKMEIDVEQLEKNYNQGLTHGVKHIENPNFSKVYKKLIRDRAHLSIDDFKAFQAGLQDGYHHHGKSHFDEWFKHEFLPSKKK